MYSENLLTKYLLFHNLLINILFNLKSNATLICPRDNTIILIIILVIIKFRWIFLDYAIAHTLIYFFNPFGIEVMKNVFEAILDSISQFPRKVTIIWYNPKYQQILEESFPLKIIKEYNWNNYGLFNSRCLLYEMSSV